MKGLVFTELLEYVENNFGFDMADKIIEEAKLPNNGSFTQAGNYPFEELVRLVVALSKESNIEVPKLLEIFGEHMFSRLISLNPQLKDNFESSLDLRKLTLPLFQSTNWQSSLLYCLVKL